MNPETEMVLERVERLENRVERLERYVADAIAAHQEGAVLGRLYAAALQAYDRYEAARRDMRSRWYPERAARRADDTLRILDRAKAQLTRRAKP